MTEHKSGSSSYNRREFSKLLLMASAAGILAPYGNALARNGEEIVVLGAGIAGLSAARALAQRGFKVKIIEARNRVGGRISTSKIWPDSPVDLGAGSIHGIEHNPLTDLLGRYKVSTRQFDYNSITTYGPEGDRLGLPQEESLNELGDEVLSFFRREKTVLKSAAQTDTSLLGQDDTGITLGDAAKDFGGACHGVCGGNPAYLNYVLNTRVEQEYAADISNLSLQGWDTDLTTGQSDVVLPQGFSQLTDGLLKDALASGAQLHLDTVVERISYNRQGVVINAGRKVMIVDRVLVTLPLGALKAKSVIFNPALPEWKQGSIDRLGVGLENRLILRFSHRFWDNSNLIDHIDPQKGRFARTVNFSNFSSQPVLIFSNAAGFASTLEAASDSETVAGAMAVLRGIYGRSVPAPVSAQISRWGQDPWALGSYSHIPPGAAPEDYDTMAMPVAEGRLLFAGEATHRAYAQRVHGAYLSGLREARRILFGDFTSPAAVLEQG